MLTSYVLSSHPKQASFLGHVLTTLWPDWPMYTKWSVPYLDMCNHRKPLLQIFCSSGPGLVPNLLLSCCQNWQWPNCLTIFRFFSGMQVLPSIETSVIKQSWKWPNCLTRLARLKIHFHNCFFIILCIILYVVLLFLGLKVYIYLFVYCNLKNDPNYIYYLNY